MTTLQTQTNRHTSTQTHTQTLTHTRCSRYIGESRHRKRGKRKEYTIVGVSGVVGTGSMHTTEHRFSAPKGDHDVEV